MVSYIAKGTLQMWLSWHPDGEAIFDFLSGSYATTRISERGRWNVRIRGGVKKKEGNVWRKGTFKNHVTFSLRVKFKYYLYAFSGDAVVKNPSANAGEVSSILGLGRFPGVGNGNPLQYSCLENSRGRGIWRGTVSHAVAELEVTEHTQASIWEIHFSRWR